MPALTSKDLLPPEDEEEMGDGPWFNPQTSALWPYMELREGEDLQWYETSSRAIVWKAPVAQLVRFTYRGLDAAIGRLDEKFDGDTARTQPYLNGKPDKGYYLGYRVDPVQRLWSRRSLTISKVNQPGWERGDIPEVTAGLRSQGEQVPRDVAETPLAPGPVPLTGDHDPSPGDGGSEPEGEAFPVGTTAHPAVIHVPLKRRPDGYPARLRADGLTVSRLNLSD